MKEKTEIKEKSEAQENVIAVLGSTGSVGEQALDVADKLNYRVCCISANKNAKRAEEQARKFRVRAVAMADSAAAKQLKLALADTDIRVYAEADGICRMIAEQEHKTVVNSIVGEAGLMPTLAVIETGSRLALANKESLVVAGEIVGARARERGVDIIPVDSEHSAIFQCLKAGQKKEVKRILLTASGGPFFGYSREQLRAITLEDALAHPTWKMGSKITIDSATLMNKGFEVIEAVHLFGVSAEQIKVVVHRESIIHSMVEYIDNSIIAQMSVPDMRLCAQYAMTYPDRAEAAIAELDLFKVARLTFASPDTEAFPLLDAAYACIKKGGAMPAILNAANEIAVGALLAGRLPFFCVAEVVCQTLEQAGGGAFAKSLDDILYWDGEARRISTALAKKYSID